MFTIYGGKTEFNQWEQGQMVTNPNMAVGDMVRFWNGSGETHPMIAYTHEGVVVVDVPNDLLQRAAPILVDLCKDPERLTRFTVNFVSCKAPEDYQFVDNTHCEPVVPPGGGSGGGGGVTSWNDLEDKPFGTEQVNVNLKWDGNTDGCAVFNENGEYVRYYKISDEVHPGFVGGNVVVTLTESGADFHGTTSIVEGVAGLQTTVYINGIEYNVYGITVESSKHLSASFEVAVIVPEGDPNYEAGTYLAKTEYHHVSALMHSYETVHKIDSKYLPTGGGGGGGNILPVTFNLISDLNSGRWSVECNTTFQQVDEVVKNFGFILSQVIYMAGTPEARGYPCHSPHYCAAGEYERTEQECYVFETQQYLGCDVWLNADGTPGFFWWD